MANHTILLIDYEPRSIERFRDPLIRAGYAVEIATDGLSGIEAFQRLNPDMVMVEAMIPKKHGFEVCQELKRTPHGRRTPVLITTSVYKGRKYRTQALHIYGCDEYIEKPIAPEQLLEIVTRFLGPGASTPPGPISESSASPEGGAGEPSKGHDGTKARAVAPQETPTQVPPRSIPPARARHEDGEAEIMARLDAILPEGGTTTPAVTHRVPVAAAPILEPVMETTEDDPLAQIRAELDAELNAVFGTIEPAPQREQIPTDHVESPTVLEVLPSPEPETDPLPPITTVETEPVRESVAAAATDAAPSTPSPARPQNPTQRVPLPQSRRVEPPQQAKPGRKGIRGWVWVGAVISASFALYLLFMFLAKDGQRIEALPSPVSPLLTTESKAAPAKEPPNDPPAEAKDLVLNAVSPLSPEPRKPEDIAPAPAPAPQHAPTVAPRLPGPSTRASIVPSPAAAAPARKAPVTAPPETESRAPSQIVETPPVPPITDQKITGVETVPDAVVATAPPTTAPGMLVPIDEADAVPVSITRKPPVYSGHVQALNLSGTVIMNVLVNEHGTVDQVVLVSGIPGAGLNDSAIRAAKSWTYRPATKRGIPVKVWKSEQIVFGQ